MVVSHGNTLRALVKRIEGLSEDDVFHLDLPTATPLVYDYDADLNHLKAHGLWGDRPGVVRHGRYLVDEARVRAAQDAMRSQVKQNIAYSTKSSTSGGPLIEAACVAQSAGSAVTEIEGEGYTVRQTPPAYFFQESLRLADQAKNDLEAARRQRWSTKQRGQKKRVRMALVLLRHGQSVYNQEKVFTGWADPDLTNRGREEARLAGQLLRAAGVRKVEGVYTSLLKRAVKTAWLALDEMELTLDARPSHVAPQRAQLRWAAGDGQGGVRRAARSQAGAKVEARPCRPAAAVDGSAAGGCDRPKVRESLRRGEGAQRRLPATFRVA